MPLAFADMGVATEIGYTHRAINPFQRMMQAFGSTPVGAWFFSKTIATLDRVCNRVTNGRTSLPQVLAGLPVVFVTTTGRRSGRPRTTPLIAVPTGDDLALIGTNFGQPSTPGWVFNLEADPSAHLAYRDAQIDSIARPATDAERDAIWAAAASVYPGYRAYQRRITRRDVRVFILEVAPT